MGEYAMTVQPQFPEVHTIRLPSGFRAALTILAQRRYCTVQDQIRRILADGLEAAGIAIDPTKQRLTLKGKPGTTAAQATPQ
jgi:hypothetical protein